MATKDSQRQKGFFDVIDIALALYRFASSSPLLSASASAFSFLFFLSLARALFVAFLCFHPRLQRSLMFFLLFGFQYLWARPRPRLPRPQQR